jgi:glucokinase
MLHDRSWSGRLFDGANYVFLLLFAAVAVYPFVFVAINSFSDTVSLVPRRFSLEAYRYIFSTPTLPRSLLVSVCITLAGTALSLALTSVTAYPLSKTTFAGRRFMLFLALFTILFNGGMIPTYFVVKGLGLIDSYWALVLPGAISAFNLIVIGRRAAGGGGRAGEAIEESVQIKHRGGLARWFGKPGIFSTFPFFNPPLDNEGNSHLYLGRNSGKRGSRKTMNRYAIVFDVGGTSIKAAVVREDGETVPDTVETFPSCGKEGKETLLAHFYGLIAGRVALLDKLSGGAPFEVIGVGYAFPSPFDYENGICYIRGQDKYDALYGTNLREAMKARIAADAEVGEKLSAQAPIVFDNDAAMFAAGQLAFGHAKRYRRSICITIGTGTGSSFIDENGIVKGRELWNDPFRDGIADDYISKRGMLRVAAAYGLGADGDVKAIADAARTGDTKAADAFASFGRLFGELLAPYIREFRPEAIIVGGNIAKSHELFIPSAKAEIVACGVPSEEVPAFETAKDTSGSAFAGALALLKAER